MVGNFRCDLAIAKHVGKVTHTFQKTVGDTWSATATASNFVRSLIINLRAKLFGGFFDNVRQLLGAVQVKAHLYAKTVTQGGCKVACFGCCTNQSKLFQLDVYAGGTWALAHNKVQSVVLHCWVQNFLQGRVKSVYFVDEKHFVGLKFGQNCRKVELAWDGGATCDGDRHAHFVCDDVRQSGFTKSWRAVQKYVIQTFATSKRRLDVDGHVLLYLVLTDIVIKGFGTKDVFRVTFVFR